MTKENTMEVEVYVTLLEEGTDTIRATDALSLGNDLYQLLPTENYDPEDEIWEFKPGSIVKIKPAKDFHGNRVLIAYEEVNVKE